MWLCRFVDLDPEDRIAAIAMPMGRDEWQHHVRVSARIWDCTPAQAEARIIKERDAPVTVPEAAPARV